MRGSLVLLFLLMFGALDAQNGGKWGEALNTAKDAEYLSSVEQAVVFEMNKVRSNPKRYALEVILPLKKRFSESDNPYIFYNVDSVRILSKEGVAAIDECAKELMGLSPLGLLVPSKGLSSAAADHTTDQGKTGRMGHNGKDGSTPWKRMERYGSWLTTCGENIDYGNNDAQSIVVSLLVDDGVPSRGHRRSIVNGAFKVVGVAVGAHPKFRSMCTIDFAGGFDDKR